MTETQIPDAIQHLDFDPDAEEKEDKVTPCRIPLARHPVTDSYLHCGSPAVYQVVWGNMDQCDCTPRVATCATCWSGYTEDKIWLSCKKHDNAIHMKHLTSLTPIK